MTTYLITHRSEDSQLIHREGSAEEAACEIANQLLMFYGSAEKLMAIKSDSPLATFSLIKDDVLCSIDVTKKSIETWRNDISSIRTAMNEFHSAKNRAESILSQALDDLDNAFDSSEALGDFVPSDDISVYGVLDELGIGDLETTFRRALRDMYKFKTYQRSSV